jgi:nucleoside-diphosphate-sugar epimerase
MNFKEFEGSNVLITGGAGFIGSNLAKKLVEIGANVIVADNLSRGSLENLSEIINKIKFYKVDLTDINNCIKVSQGVDYIFHLASSVGGIHYISKVNVEQLSPSVTMNINMLEAARKNDVKGFLFTSSACVYRSKTNGLNVFKEEDAYPANPPTTYGWAKILGEIACKAYYKDYGIKCSVPRIFNAYGENENLDLKWAHVIPSLVRKAIMYPKERFVILGNGSQQRAFLYVQDCVEGLLRCMLKANDAEPINLGSNEVVTINEVALKIIKILGKEIKIEYDLNGTVGVKGYCADLTKMKEKLEWVPKTNLEEGLRRTIEWSYKKLNNV